MQKEIDFLGNAVNNPARPFVAILGGSKVSSKISVINNLLDKVDTLIIGGGMAYTFMKAQGGKIGTSLCEDDYLDYANDMIKKAADKGVKMLIPVDTVTADAFSNDANVKVVDAGQIDDGWMGLDIGPKTENCLPTLSKMRRQLYGMDRWVYSKCRTLLQVLLQLLRHWLIQMQ